MKISIDRAIQILDPEHREHYDGLDEVNEACRMGMEALKKQKALPPDEDRDDEMWYDFLCPRCHSILDFRYGYCPECGQKLEWTEDEMGDEP